jgi:cation:H+ antiporter
MLFIFGLLCIIKGGDLFVDAAVWLARVSGIPPVIVGATVVSLATTLPEITVSLLAATQGKVDLAIGNAVGSVTANLGLILGAALIFAPVCLHRRDFALRGCLMVAAIAVLLICSDGEVLPLGGSMVLLGIFVLFMLDSVHTARRGMESQPALHPERNDLLRQGCKFLLGTGGILLGARLLVNNGSLLALRLGVPESVVGVTLVAVGTSLPELVSALTALSRGEGSLSVGNIVGANILDLTLILPLCALLNGGHLTLPRQSLSLDMPFCLILCAVAVTPPLLAGRFRRGQGAALLVIYGIYVSRVITA